jgi:hypothetical protein
MSQQMPEGENTVLLPPGPTADDDDLPDPPQTTTDLGEDQ